MEFPHRINGLLGTPTSSRAIRPPGRTARASSAKNSSRFVRLRKANPHVTPSTKWSGVGSWRMSVCTRGEPDRSAASIPKLRSIEIGRRSAFARSMQRSPVPEARSSTTDPGGNRKSRTARFRHLVSRRNVMILFTMSYRGAIVSNISRIAARFASPCGNVSPSHGRAVVVVSEDSFSVTSRGYDDPARTAHLSAARLRP